VEKQLEQFRQEVERLRAGRKAGSGPFPEPLRAFAVRYLAYALEKGDTLKAVVFYSLIETARLRGEDPGATCCVPRSPPSRIPAPSRSRPVPTDVSALCLDARRRILALSRWGAASCYDLVAPWSWAAPKKMPREKQEETPEGWDR
jgi:hypothetical protein